MPPATALRPWRERLGLDLDYVVCGVPAVNAAVLLVQKVYGNTGMAGVGRVNSIVTPCASASMNPGKLLGIGIERPYSVET